MIKFPKILVVDDSLDALMIMRVVLSRKGLDVRTASSGAHALEIFAEFRPHVVILDLGLPDMSGYQVCEEMRVMQKDTTLILAQTGRNGEEMKRRCLESGFNNYYLKPVPADHLLEAVNKFIADA